MQQVVEVVVKWTFSLRRVKPLLSYARECVKVFFASTGVDYGLGCETLSLFCVILSDFFFVSPLGVVGILVDVWGYTCQLFKFKKRYDFQLLFSFLLHCVVMLLLCNRLQS